MKEKPTQTDPYLKACEALGKTPLPPLADRSDPDLVASDAFYRLTICIRAKNMIDGRIWVPVYDGSEWHYWPRWIKNSSGLGFACTDYDYWNTGTDVGPRLEYRTLNLLREGVVEFKSFYDEINKIAI